MSSDILIVDDEADIRELVAGILEDEGYETRTAHDSDSALAEIKNRKPNLIFLDIWLQGSRLDGLSLLDSVKQYHPNVPVVMISGHGNIETAVSAIRRGAYDYIEKPFKADRLVLVAERALENSKLKREVSELRQRSGETDKLIGQSTVMAQLRTAVEKVAPTNSRVMIFGPTGSGKELVARTIHQNSMRKNGPFVIVNSATLTSDMSESALFGIEASSNNNRQVGALEEAHGGTLYLDEIADMPIETQNKILRVLTEQGFYRIGGTRKVHVDIRIFSSTSRNIVNEIASGHFREELYHRLSVVPIKVPALSERREDIPLLVEYFIKQISDVVGISLRKIEQDAMTVLQAHPWPGNIRQLRNNIERLLILTRDDENIPLSANLLPKEIGDLLPFPDNNVEHSKHMLSLSLREAREVFEKEYLNTQLNRFGGNVSKAAEFVGMERSALHRKLKSLRLI